MIEAARTRAGISPAYDFLTSFTRTRIRGLSLPGVADVVVRFEDFARNGTLEIPMELRELRNEIWEIKIGKIRLPFFWLQQPFQSTAIRITHGFIKRTQKAPREEIDKAKWIREEDLT